MATPTLDATVGGVSSNTYATLAEADLWHDSRPASGTTWADASDGDKNKALLFATVLLDSLVVWAGAVTDKDQALLWPRQGLTHRNRQKAVATDVVPQEIKDAQSELARQLLADVGRTDDYDVEAKGLTRIKAGSIELEFDRAAARRAMPDLVADLIPPDWYIKIRGRSQRSVMLARA